MNNVTVIGLDLAKHVFQVHGMDSKGTRIISRKLARKEVLQFFATVPPCLVGIEACGGAHAWARKLMALGHTVKMMAPQYVKAFVQGNKTDARDAAAIAEAAIRASIPSVKVKSLDEQQLQAMLRVLQRRGHNIAACAQAAKNARRIWAWLRNQDVFRTNVTGVSVGAA